MVGSFGMVSARQTARIVCVVCTLVLAALALSACAPADSSSAGSPAVVYLSSDALPSVDSPSSSSAGADGSSSGSSASASSSSATGSSSSSAAADEPVTYPTGWLAVAQGDVPAGSAVRVLQLPEIAIEPHRAGAPLSEQERRSAASGWPVVADGQALVEYGGSYYPVDPNVLLVNVPDVVPGAICDVVYSYASTSRCADQDIPGVTGEHLPGYAEGAQMSAYWNEPRFVAPCAYRTALKVRQVEEALEAQGLRLLLYDAYRPISAQYYLSDAFQSAFNSNPTMQASLGAWALEWYVASGASGHNYGTDIDAGVCDLAGNPLPMPSAFDAFDESGHLTDSPMDSGAIGPESYREAVSQNDACMALHQAFTTAGFSELASEWWHFGDEETEGAMRAIAGSAGLDFTALMA